MSKAEASYGCFYFVLFFTSEEEYERVKWLFKHLTSIVHQPQVEKNNT